LLFEPACEPSLAARPSDVRAGARRFPADPGDRLIDRYRVLSLLLVFTMIVIAALLVLGSGVAADSSGTGLAAQLLAAALLASAVCRANPRLSRMADCCGTLGLAWLAGLAGGMMSLAGLRFHLPLADRSLLQLDQALGVDTPRLVEWLLSQTAWPATITMSYNYTVPVICLSLVAQSLAGRRVEAWRAALCFIGALLTVCVISILTPAKGLGMWLSTDVLAQLPNGAARYFWPSFDQFYSPNADPILTLAAIDGVVSFPSFHTVMGLITVALWRHSPVAFGLATAWFVQMMIGTLPLGGHYFVDLLGGAAVWAGWFALSRRLERKALEAA
jgi:membrane-associated phospholipid phosphatase